MTAGQRWSTYRFNDGVFIVTVTTRNPHALENLKRCHPGIAIDDITPNEEA